MILIIYYILCFSYCTWRFVKRSKKTSVDGVIGNTPAFDAVLTMLLCWILAPIDIVVTCKRYITNRFNS